MKNGDSSFPNMKAGDITCGAKTGAMIGAAVPIGIITDVVGMTTGIRISDPGTACS